MGVAVRRLKGDKELPVDPPHGGLSHHMRDSENRARDRWGDCSRIAGVDFLRLVLKKTSAVQLPKLPALCECAGSTKMAVSFPNLRAHLFRPLRRLVFLETVARICQPSDTLRPKTT